MHQTLRGAFHEYKTSRPERKHRVSKRKHLLLQLQQSKNEQRSERVLQSPPKRFKHLREPRLVYTNSHKKKKTDTLPCKVYSEKDKVHYELHQQRYKMPHRYKTEANNA